YKIGVPKVNIGSRHSWATITLTAKRMRRRTKITTKRPSAEETADLVGLPRRHARELVSLVDEWLARDSRPARIAARKKSNQGTVAGKKAGKSAPSKNSRS